MNAFATTRRGAASSPRKRPVAMPRTRPTRIFLLKLIRESTRGKAAV